VNLEHPFPNTRWSLILEAQGSDSELGQRALEQICQSYWLPIYAYARSRGLAPADAEDLTQNVLAHLLKAGAFRQVDESKGKLRTFLMVATRNFLKNEWKKAGRIKRGGGAPVISFDCEEAEELCAFELADAETPEKSFERHWAINLLHQVMERLEATYVGEGKGELFAELKEVLGQRVVGNRYKDLGDRLEMSEGAIKVAVYRLRKRYRRILEEQISHTIDDPSEAAIAEEVNYLFGVFAS
jgi:RNA polymerase sigma factor (sigma-70 family)